MAIHFLQWPLNLPLDFTRHSPSPLAKRAFPLPPDARLIINRCITFMAISLPTHLPSSLSSLSVRAISLVLSLPSTAASLLWRFHSCSNSLPGGAAAGSPLSPRNSNLHAFPRTRRSLAESSRARELAVPQFAWIFPGGLWEKEQGRGNLISHELTRFLLAWPPSLTHADQSPTSLRHNAHPLFWKIYVLLFWVSAVSPAFCLQLMFRFTHNHYFFLSLCIALTLYWDTLGYMNTHPEM